MGFFSSRRPEQQQEQLNNDVSVVQVIRSRFYGKQKGKEREVQPATSTSFASSQASSIVSSPLLSPDSLSIHDSGSPRKTDLRYQPSSPSSSRSRPPNLTITTESHRTSTDALTITLAQRLNELAVANSQGLLDDDEYRLLRQNLFDRLAGGSTVPTETPIVPVSATPRDGGDGRASSSHTRHPSSSFQGQGPRTPSLASKRSFTSTVSGFLKRSTSKRRSSLALDPAPSDAGSVFSSPRTPDRFTFAAALNKQHSEASLRTESARQDSDTFSSRHTMYDRTHVSQVFRSPDSKSSRSIRRTPSVPPSSFPGVPLSPEARHAHMSIIDNLEDDERLQTSAEIRQEIELVEAEGRRLLDAFNGLELSTLVRQQRHHTPLATATLFHSPIDPEGSGRMKALSPLSSLAPGKDSDAMSVISAGSGRTALSRKRSPSVSSRSRNGQLNAGNSAPVFQPVSLGRKTSLSSMSSRNRSGTTASQSVGRLGFGSTSSVNLSRSSGHLPLATVSETEAPYVSSPLKSKAEHVIPLSSADSQYSASVKHLRNGEDEDIAALEAEMADIRRRRTEVTARYQARVEYLRARLKGAELHEKLMKR